MTKEFPKIESFSGEYSFLSNFYPSPIVYRGTTYENVEVAFQAQKCADQADKALFVGITPGAAKRLGRKVKLRSDWESIKDQVMYELVLAKFSQNEDLKAKLFLTNGFTIEEGNYWNDTYWGICKGIGQNKLGRILMKVREEILNSFIDEVLDSVGDIK